MKTWIQLTVLAALVCGSLMGFRAQNRKLDEIGRMTRADDTKLAVLELHKALLEESMGINQSLIEARRGIIDCSKLVLATTSYLDAAGNTHSAEATVLDARRNLKEAEAHARAILK